jgi:hypothetical protein
MPGMADENDAPPALEMRLRLAEVLDEDDALGLSASTTVLLCTISWRT